MSKFVWYETSSDMHLSGSQSTSIVISNTAASWGIKKVKAYIVSDKQPGGDVGLVAYNVGEYYVNIQYPFMSWACQ